jgi:glycosyltransferase involved in cell wall biosynthesis
MSHVYWFAYYNLDEPSVRYRAKYPLDQLAQRFDIGYTIVYPGYDWISISSFLRAYFSVLFFRKAESWIVFQKINTSGIYTVLLKVLVRLRPRRTLYDIDDAEYVRMPAGVMHYFMRHCACCSAGSQSLVAYINKFNTSVFLLTSPVIDHGVTKTTRTENQFTIGWIGYYGAHLPSLSTLFMPGLRELNFPVTFKIMGVSSSKQLEDIRQYYQCNPCITIEAPLNIDWHDEMAIYKVIQTFDIGVSPLLDTAFNQAKSAFKLKQCLSCGVPVLASSVGENLRFLRDGVNGYFCNSPVEYHAKINLIKSHSDKTYAKMCIEAKASFTKFSLDYYCDTLVTNLKLIPPTPLAPLVRI